MYMYICNKLVLIFWGEKLVGANFYAFCNYDTMVVIGFVLDSNKEYT